MPTYTAFSNQVASCISCHAVSPSGDVLAICPSSSEVIILERTEGSHWRFVCRLEGHDQIISGLDFSEDSAGLRLVSSSHDRNSYVWTQGSSTSTWSLELVITKLSRAGLCVQWSPAGTGKFAIGSGEKSLCVCYFDGSKELWAPKLIKKQHGSSVTAVAWHPSGSVLATASTDKRCRVFNAAIPDIDGGSESLPPAVASSHFGELLLEVECPSWVLAVAWAPDGSTLACCSQDASLTLLSGLDLGEPSSLASPRRQQLQLPQLPLKCLAFLSGGLLVGAGFDFRPLLFRREQSGEWGVVPLEPGPQQGGSAGSASRNGSASSSSSLSARIKLFESQVAKAQPKAGGSRAPASDGAGGGAAESQGGGSRASIEQPHSNCIMSVTRLGPSSFLTSGLDGRVVEWQIQGL